MEGGTHLGCVPHKYRDPICRRRETIQNKGRPPKTIQTMRRLTLAPNRLNDLMAQKYQPKITEADLFQDVEKISQTLGKEYAGWLSGCTYIAEDFAWVYYRRLHEEYTKLATSGQLGEDRDLFKPLLDMCKKADERYHHNRQYALHTEDNKIDMIVERCFDREFGIKLDFFHLEMCCDNIIKKHFKEGNEAMNSVRKYALMVIVMVDLSFDMFNYAESVYSTVDIRYKINDKNAIRRQNGITNRLRASMEVFLDGMDVEEAMKGNLETSRGVFKSKLIMALNKEFKR